MQQLHPQSPSLRSTGRQILKDSTIMRKISESRKPPLLLLLEDIHRIQKSQQTNSEEKLEAN